MVQIKANAKTRRHEDAKKKREEAVRYFSELLRAFVPSRHCVGFNSRQIEKVRRSFKNGGACGESGFGRGGGYHTSTLMTAVLPAMIETESPASSGWVRRYLFSLDHKTIGIQYLFAGLAFFMLGGLLAMLMRWQLAWPNDPTHPVPILGKLLGWDGGTLPAEMYNMVLTLHATVMIFFVLIPLQVGAFGNYLIPLKIGARDMAFPFLNGLSFWMYIPAGTILLAGVCLPGGAAATGWTSYPPVSAILYNGRGHETAARGFLALLQIKGSTWPTLPVAVNSLSLFLMFAFVVTSISPEEPGEKKRYPVPFFFSASRRRETVPGTVFIRNETVPGTVFFRFGDCAACGRCCGARVADNRV